MRVSSSDWPTEASRRRDERAGSGVGFKADEETLRPDDQTPADRHEESNPENEDRCSSSVQEYLDSCFPAAQPEPEPPHCGSPDVPPLSTHTQFLTTWTLSQALIRRGRCAVQSAGSPEKTPPKHTQTPPSVSSSTPELFSPVPPSLGSSAELFSPPCPSPRAEEGGVVIQATIDGVLCSQEAKRQEATPSQKSPAKSPELKRARVSENIRTEASAVTSERAVAAAIELRGPTTLLTRCDRRGVRYSVLVAVVHPCHLKEVKVGRDLRLCHVLNDLSEVKCFIKGLICWGTGEVRAGGRDRRSSGIHCGNGPIRRRDEGGAVAAVSVLGVDSRSWRRSAHHRYRNTPELLLYDGQPV